MHKVIFVNGTARCGSTLVDLILGNDPRGFSLGEVTSWFRPWRTHHFDIKCGCGVYPCPVWERLRTVPESRLYHEVFATQDADFTVDSSKKLTWVIDQNRRLQRSSDVEVFNLLLYKEPVALHHSHWKRGFDDPGRTAAQYYYYENALRAGMRPIAINYDWFVREIDISLPLLCERLGIEYFAGKERFWEKTHHQLFGSFGPRSQMFADNPAIYVESLSEDYLSLTDELEARFQSDSRLQNTLSELRARDIRSAGDDSRVSGGNWRRPLFYWKQRWAERRLRRSPQPWPDREAATIHTWNV